MSGGYKQEPGIRSSEILGSGGREDLDNGREDAMWNEEGGWAKAQRWDLRQHLARSEARMMSRSWTTGTWRRSVGFSSKVRQLQDSQEQKTDIVHYLIHFHQGPAKQVLNPHSSR